MIETGSLWRTEQVYVLVDGIAGNGREAELLNKFTADVDDLALEGTDLQGLHASSLEVLCEKRLVTARRLFGAGFQIYLLGQHRPLKVELASIPSRHLGSMGATY